jgi:hypothetical protein
MVAKRQFPDLNKGVLHKVLHKTCSSWLKTPEKLLSRISKSNKQSNNMLSNAENPRISIYSKALIVGKHLVK